MFPGYVSERDFYVYLLKKNNRNVESVINIMLDDILKTTAY